MISKSISNELVGVIGAGSFGTAVANLLAYNANVLVYVRRKEALEAMEQSRTAAGQQLAPNITLTNALEEVAENCPTIFPVLPSEGFRAMMQALAPLLKSHHTLIHGTKGLDVRWPQETPPEELPNLSRNDVKTMSEVIQEETGLRQVGCMAGPNLARELAQGQPAAAVIASPSEEVIAKGKKLLRSERFQVYSSKELVGVELCGALKNIMAIAAGCLGGLGYGENAKALLISRGIAEMVRIGRAMGAGIQPFMGLAGIGDLVATCSSRLSRNYTVGHRLAQGETLTQILQSAEETAEGIHTVKVALGLANYYQIRVPITETMYRVFFKALPAQDAVHYLMKYPINLDVDFL